MDDCLIIKNDERIKQFDSWELNEEIQIFREYLRIPSVHPSINYGRLTSSLDRRSSFHFTSTILSHTTTKCSLFLEKKNHNNMKMFLVKKKIKLNCEKQNKLKISELFFENETLVES